MADRAAISEAESNAQAHHIAASEAESKAQEHHIAASEAESQAMDQIMTIQHRLKNLVKVLKEAIHPFARYEYPVEEQLIKQKVFKLLEGGAAHQKHKEHPHQNQNQKIRKRIKSNERSEDEIKIALRDLLKMWRNWRL